MTAQSLARIGLLIRNKRQQERMGLREAAWQSGVSASTLSRVERGMMTDTQTLTKLAAWLGTSLGDLLPSQVHFLRGLDGLSTLDKVEVVFSSDDRLTPEGKEVLVGLIRHVYAALTR